MKEAISLATCLAGLRRRFAVEPRLVCFIGGGGKTGLMYLWARCLKAAGYGVITAATTKLAATPQPGVRFLPAPDLDAARRVCSVASESSEIPTLHAGVLAAAGKLAGLPAQWLDELHQEFSRLFFLVEGDGSAGRSLKGHNPYEPVIPSGTELVVPLIGLDAVGQPITAPWVHRPERFCAVTGARPAEPTTTAQLASLLLHPDGYLQKSPSAAAILPVFNKAETAAAWASGLALAQAVLAARRKNLEQVLVGSVKHDRFRVIA